MRQSLVLCGLVLLSAIPTPASAQDSGAQAVATANSAFDAALSRRDLAAIEAMWLHAPHVMAIHPASRSPVLGWEAVRRSWMETFERFPELSVTLAEPQTHITGNVAWVVGIETVRGRRPDGVEVTFAALTTNVYELREGRWLIVLHHASRAPQSKGIPSTTGRGSGSDRHCINQSNRVKTREAAKATHDSFRATVLYAILWRRRTSLASKNCWLPLRHRVFTRSARLSYRYRCGAPCDALEC